jgi:protein SCO1/2
MNRRGFEGFQETPAFALSGLFGWLAISAGWWVFAFARLPAPPAWLERARGVCFGMRADGLPDASGWTLLVLGPLSMLAFLAVAWRSELVHGLKRLRRSRVGQVILALVFGLLGLGAAAVLARVRDARAVDQALTATFGEPLPAGYPRTLLEAPALDLVDQAGERVSIATLRGRPVLLAFAYAHCQTVCPQLVGTVRAAISELAVDPAASRPRVVVVTLDPWRDTPGSLPALAAAWDPGGDAEARFLSGDVEEVQRVLAAWNVPISRDETTGEIAHPGLLVVLDADGRIAYRFVSPVTRWVIDAVRRAAQPA